MIRSPSPGPRNDYEATRRHGRPDLGGRPSAGKALGDALNRRREKRPASVSLSQRAAQGGQRRERKRHYTNQPQSNWVEVLHQRKQPCHPPPPLSPWRETNREAPRRDPTYPLTESHSPITGFDARDQKELDVARRSSTGAVRRYSLEELEDQIDNSDFSHTTNQSTLASRRAEAEEYSASLATRNTSCWTNNAYAGAGRRWDEFTGAMGLPASSTSIQTARRDYGHGRSPTGTSTTGP